MLLLMMCMLVVWCPLCLAEYSQRGHRGLSTKSDRQNEKADSEMSNFNMQPVQEVAAKGQI